MPLLIPFTFLQCLQYNQTVRDATAYLRTELVQQVAGEIDRTYDLSRRTFHSNQAEFGAWLARVLHMNGVSTYNTLLSWPMFGTHFLPDLRYLGLIRSHSRNSNARKHILAEMVARYMTLVLARMH